MNSIQGGQTEQGVQEWLTLNDASELTGIKSATLRQNIKRGKYKGKKDFMDGKEVWFINRVSIVHLLPECIPEHIYERTPKSSVVQESCAPVHPINNPICAPEDEQVYAVEHTNEQTRTPEEEQHLHLLELLIKEKNERIRDLSSRTDEQNALLGIFIARIKNLEEYEKQVKMLPAPAEEVTRKLETLTDQVVHLEADKDTLRLRLEEETKEKERLAQEKEAEAQERERLAEELRQARLPWWKKLFK